MAGGMGRPGANIGAGLPQARGQAPQVSAPQTVTEDAPMPMINAPAISPMQQYMLSLGINRTPYNPQAYPSGGYAGPRAPQIFQPQLRPQLKAVTQPVVQSAGQDDPEYQAWLAQRNSAANGGGGGNN